MRLAVAVYIVVLLLGQHGSGQSTVQVCPNSGASGDEQGCLSLQQALGNVSSDSTLVLEQGVHYIGEFQLVQSLHNVTIVGVNSTHPESVTVTCADSVGLSFVNVSDLTIGNIKIDGCGLSGENLTKSVESLPIIRFYSVPQDVRIALFLGHCEHLLMYHVTVSNTLGFGIVGINIIGQSRLSDMQFLNNTQSGNCSEYRRNISYTPEGSRSIFENVYQLLGGGLFLLYHDYVPELQDLYMQQLHTLEVEQSTFVGNSECSFNYISEYNYIVSSALQSLGYTIGVGGGLSLVLTQLYYGIDVDSTSLMFLNNTASFGSGTHVTLYSGVANTHVSFANCTYIDNGDKTFSSQLNSQVLSCGGLAIISDVVRPFNIPAPHSVHDRNVTMEVLDTLFRGNGAPYIGALSITSLYTSAIEDISDVVSIFIERCIFEENISYIGSAIGSFEQKSSGRNLGIQTAVRNCTFANNTITTGDNTAEVTISQSAGILDLRSVNVTLEDDCSFEFNQGTAIRGQQAIVGVHGSVMFKGNLGVYGGALHLEEYSYIILTNSSRLYFERNTGRVAAGAIYVNFLGTNNSPLLSGGFQDCFLLFDYEFIFSRNATDINATGVYVEFNGNTAPLSSIIYGSSLSTCYWASEMRAQNPELSVLEILDRDYPNVFNFSDGKPVGLQTVGTPARRVEIENPQPSYQAGPGEVFTVNMSVFDTFEQNIPNVIQSYISSDTLQGVENVTTQSLIGTNNFGLLTGDSATMVPIRVFGNPLQNLSVLVFSIDNGGQASVQFTVNLVNCSVGFIFSGGVCECDPQLEAQGVSCDIENQQLVIPEPLWIGPIGSTNDLAVHMCAAFCQDGQKTLKVYPDVDRIDFDSQCAKEFNRGGVLCGTCKENFSVSLGSQRCRECSNAGIALILVFIALGILLVFAISFLQITVTAGYINGGIFYANIISLYIVFLAPANFNDARYFLAYFVTLNFGIESCFYNGMSGLERIVWQLLFPLYLFILMLIIRCFAKLKWFNKSRTVGLSTIQAFATLSILCYVSVLESSVELLGGVTITSINGNTSYTGWITDPSVLYFRNAHGFLAFVACLLIVCYIIPLPLLLLFPKVLYQTKYLRNFKPFYDAFYDPFEPSFRFWLGLRLMFRWIPFALAFTVPYPINTFVTVFLINLLLFVQLVVRPFKGKWRNIIDGLFLLNLILHFAGALFFTALIDSRATDDAAIVEAQMSNYTFALYALAYVMYIAILGLHVYMRFPKLWERVRKSVRSKDAKALPRLSRAHTQAEEGEEADGLGSYAEIDGLDASMNTNLSRPPVVFRSSELREPLLDDMGSVEIITHVVTQPRKP